ncbi:MAG TPA: helix-turn-helix domain-containing protein [Candidatus Nanoarchaeia archaeon]|nr:helix-turn-helix domain-containing protein [Candidatus Nanoarchaeia archaeon]
MIVKQELVNKIKDYFDLNIYETKVWLALLGKGIASAGEVSTISGVPRSRTYDVLESLEKKGFAIEKLGKPVKYIGIKPNMILEKLKNNVRKDSEDRIQDLLKIRETKEYTELESLYREGVNPVKREDISASLKGKSNISNYLREIISNAEKEVIICTNAKEFASKLKLFQQTIINLKKSNIKINIALSGEQNLIKQISEKLKVKIRKSDITAKFFIVDRKEILFYVSNEPGQEDLAIWLNSEFFSEAFASLFEMALK